MRTAMLFLLPFCLLVGCGDSPTNTLITDDAGTGADLAYTGKADLAGNPDLSATMDAASKAPQINLTFTGCSPDFSANVIVVAGNGSMAVTRSDAPLLGQIQLHLTKSSGIIAISTMERSQNGDVINVIDSTTSTNISSTMPDPIKGTLTINNYDEAAGIADLAFAGVVVENVQDHTLCTIDGTLVTHGKTF